ncbi:toll/interleukin-1 receptor domain-containing protein [Luteolibacter luteus]|uniref:TIR domain-containing protein n=1 Tax=Luteolibacter luteus TaxID=2728835 RepID=A0A858RN98_9BACT|nr:toll/interleukin-1 receptor domain-containing protein [Luteolibacter luteus]QJE98876.1 TIR domain-containing protein [Luteolibacter luteus]
MKVFVSWSQERSREIAKLLKLWIKCVIQASDPWISVRDLPRGVRWMQEIGVALDSSEMGIICLTKENKNNPWILFEAGALAKGVSKVCTLLIDLEPADLDPPLDQFNHTFATDRTSMFALIETLNAELAPSLRLSESVLKEVFDTYWDKFSQGMAQIIAATEPTVGPEPEPDTNDLLSQVLSSVRSMNNRLARVESAAKASVAVVPRVTKRDAQELRNLATDYYMGIAGLDACLVAARRAGFSEADFISSLRELYGIDLQGPPSPAS